MLLKCLKQNDCQSYQNHFWYSQNFIIIVYECVIELSSIFFVGKK